MESHDEWYNRWRDDSTSNACILRVTNKCNEKCPHCAFRSGPNQIDQMSPKICKELNIWVPNKVILNIMGGEITVLNNYPEILLALAKGRSGIRLVTNGFWSHTSSGIDKFLLTLEKLVDICGCVDVSVSTDHWHKNPGLEAQQILEKRRDIKINIIYSNLNLEQIIPIGRAWDNGLISDYLIYRSCEVMCNMIITENGMLGRCPYGYFPWKHFGETTWADAQDYIWGWRSEKLSKDMNCRLCMETVEISRRRDISSKTVSIKESENVYVH